MTKDGELNIEDEILEGNKTKNGEGTKKSAFWKRNFLSRKKRKTFDVFYVYVVV